MDAVRASHRLSALPLPDSMTETTVPCRTPLGVRRAADGVVYLRTDFTPFRVSPTLSMRTTSSRGHHSSREGDLREVRTQTNAVVSIRAPHASATASTWRRIPQTGRDSAAHALRDVLCVGRVEAAPRLDGSGVPAAALSRADVVATLTAEEESHFVADPNAERVKMRAAPAEGLSGPRHSSTDEGNTSTPMPQMRRSRGVFGLFGSLERSSLSGFLDLFRHHRTLLEPYVERVVQSIAGLYPKEVNILELLRNPGDVPDAEVFRFPLLSWPLHTLYTSSCFYVTAKLNGYEDTFEGLRRHGGLLTMGKGVFAALAVAMSPTEELLIHHVSRMMRAAYFVGLTFSECEESLLAHLCSCSQTSFLLLLVNIATASLQLLLDEANSVQIGSDTHNDRHSSNTNDHVSGNVNTDYTNKVNRGVGAGGSGDGSCSSSGAALVVPFSQVEMVRIISPRSAIVCGHPLDLQRLSALLVRYAGSTGLKVHRDFLPSSVPENSTYYNRHLALHLLRTWLNEGIAIDAPTLCMEVYSPVDGTPWSQSPPGRLTEYVAFAVTCAHHDLTYALHHLRDGDVLLDFTVSGPCLGELIAWTRRGITVLTQPAGRRGARVFHSPRRGAARGVICSTFTKCARVNHILQRMHGEGKSNCASVTELSMRFMEMGLLMDVRGGLAKSPSSSNAEESSGLSGCVSSYPTHTHPPTERNGGATTRECAESSLTFVELGGAASPVTNGTCHNSRDYVILSNEKMSAVTNVYQVSPMIKYYEMQFHCVLTRAAVEFARRLSHMTGLSFPPHTLLMCPTVLALLELWDTYEFLSSK